MINSLTSGKMRLPKDNADFIGRNFDRFVIIIAKKIVVQLIDGQLNIEPFTWCPLSLDPIDTNWSVRTIKCVSNFLID